LPNHHFKHSYQTSFKLNYQTSFAIITPRQEIVNGCLMSWAFISCPLGLVALFERKKK